MSDVKPMRGGTAPLVYYDDKAFYGESEPISFTMKFEDPRLLVFEPVIVGNDVYLFEKEKIREFPAENISPYLEDLLERWRKYALPDMDEQALSDRWTLMYLVQLVPSKRDGRKGTRKGWKRLHPPRWIRIDLWSVQFI